jgi:hypothetical protein
LGDEKIEESMPGNWGLYGILYTSPERYFFEDETV